MRGHPHRAAVPDRAFGSAACTTSPRTPLRVFPFGDGDSDHMHAHLATLQPKRWHANSRSRHRDSRTLSNISTSSEFPFAGPRPWPTVVLATDSPPKRAHEARKRLVLSEDLQHPFRTKRCEPLQYGTARARGTPATNNTTLPDVPNPAPTSPLVRHRRSRLAWPAAQPGADADGSQRVVRIPIRHSIECCETRPLAPVCEPCSRIRSTEKGLDARRPSTVPRDTVGPWRE